MTVLEERFLKEELIKPGRVLIFENLENKRIYNHPQPFKINNKLYLICRVEDPFLTEVQGWILFGGVSVVLKNPKEFLSFKTIFYYGKIFFDLGSSKPFAEGPLNIKDIRIVDLRNGRLGVFTRPQGGKFFKGRICYLEINSLDELKNLEIYKREVLINLFLEENERVGANDVYFLKEDNLGILDHYVYKDKRKRLLHYSALIFIFSPEGFQINNLKIITQRKYFPEAPVKDVSLKDIVFPGEIINKGENIFLDCGLSDENVGVILIKNPFRE